MDEYLKFKQKKSNLEEKQIDIEGELKQNDKDILDWGVKHFSEEKRKALIEMVRKNEPAWVVTEVTLLSEKWDMRDVSTEDVEKMAAFEITVQEEVIKWYTTTPIYKIHKFFFGGDKN